MKCLNHGHIRFLRKERHLSQLALCRALRARHGRTVIQRQTLNRWEQPLPLTQFDHNNITALAAFFGVPVDDLLMDAPKEPQD